MKNKINLYWFKEKKGYGNFGDELNPYIIRSISNCDVRYFDVKTILDDKVIALKTLTYSLFKKHISLGLYVKYLYSNLVSQPKILFAIGSILQYTTLNNLTVWGSGIVKKNAVFSNANFTAVRGKYTQNRLRELGYNVPSVVGDPAILLPLIYKPTISKKFKIGIIPHYIHFKQLKKMESDNVIVINLLDPIERIIDDINSCTVTLSTSLHGIITSHVYGVPSIWSFFEDIDTSPLAGDNIKFKDYFSSVNIHENKVLSFNSSTVELQVESLPQGKLIVPDKSVIRKIQINLLTVAPFPLKETFKNLLSL